jgi:hypothetical protein
MYLYLYLLLVRVHVCYSYLTSTSGICSAHPLCHGLLSTSTHQNGLKLWTAMRSEEILAFRTSLPPQFSTNFCLIPFGQCWAKSVRKVPPTWTTHYPVVQAESIDHMSRPPPVTHCFADWGLASWRNNDSMDSGQGPLTVKCRLLVSA